ncbi:MAG: Maf family nucleotide pyrophosphatase [Propionibacteriaceae bacterium]|jgi:septum formation protein|nr:Maf family nucleotide pyrophosphatase [Propionibacteriaceae bacterium]
MRLILASASPARLKVLRDAGLHPEAVVSGVDEDAITADTGPALVKALARAKAEAVAGTLLDPELIVVGCDSVFECAGQLFGKPLTLQRARERCHQVSGQSGLLHTGHHLIVRQRGTETAGNEVATTKVRFGTFSNDEIEAYLATGEPLQVAGGFTIDGYGGAFVEALEGDHSNVIGISLPLLRRMLNGLGVAYHSLW